MTEDTSCFENILKEMNSSQTCAEKVKTIKKCENTYCKSLFQTNDTCLCCNKIYCVNCLTTCENCGIKICKFCTRIDYSKFHDRQVCPTCL